MKKSTMFLLAAAVVLAVVVVLVTGKSGPDAPKKLDLAGYATPEQLAAEKKLGMMDARPEIVHPIDEVVLERADGTLRFVRSGEGDKATWRLTSPVDAPAVKYQVEQIVELFKTPTTRMDARTLKGDKDLPLFDLEPSRRIGLTLKSKGAVWNGVDLVVGQVVKDGDAKGEEQVKGTWVLVKGDATTAFLVADKDLRTPANKPLSDLRDKKAFDFEADAVSRVEIVEPGGDKVVITGVTTETPPAPDAGPDAKPTKSTTWTFAEPAGVKGDAAVSNVARNVANLRVSEFIAEDKAPAEAKQALAEGAWKIIAKVGDKDVVLRVSAAAKEPIYAQVEGKAELMTLAAYAANNVRKGIDELEDKTVWDVAADAVTSLSLEGDAGPITLSKTDGVWKFVEPAVAYPADASAFLQQGGKLTAVRWAKKGEVEAASAALAAPDADTIQAALRTADRTYALRIGPVIAGGEGGGQNRWAALEGGKPFLVQDFTAKRFVSNVDALRLKKLFAKGKDDIVAVSIQRAGTSEVAQLEKPSTGGDLTLVSPPAGKVGDDEPIRTIVATLGALDAKSFHEGKGADVTGLEPAKCTKVVVRFSDGTTSTLWVSATSAGEGTQYAMVDAGPLASVPVAINEYQAKNLAKPLAELTKDAELPGTPEPPPAP